MKLSELAAKPKLISVTIDDEEIVKKYNEPIVFYTYDRQPIDTFMRLANSDQNNIAGMIDVVRNLLLDEKGKPILNDEVMLPTDVLIKAIGKVTEMLGK